MANSILGIGIGILSVILGGVLLQVGTQVNSSLDDSFSCVNITNANGEEACNTTKDNIWLVLQIASYGLLFGGLFLVFAPVMGRFF